MVKCVLAIDQKTASSRAILFDENLQVTAVSQQEFESPIARQLTPTCPDSRITIVAGLATADVSKGFSRRRYRIANLSR